MRSVWHLGIQGGICSAKQGWNVWIGWCTCTCRANHMLMPELCCRAYCPLNNRAQMGAAGRSQSAPYMHALACNNVWHFFLILRSHFFLNRCPTGTIIKPLASFVDLQCVHGAMQ